MPKPPVDPYARGNVVPPMKTAQKTSYEVAHRARGGTKPLWGHHSNRRCSDTVARQTMAETGASEQDIDLVFGWMEAMYSARMQLHYESKFDREKRKAVTRRMLSGSMPASTHSLS